MRLVVVLLHGHGAPPDEMSVLAATLPAPSGTKIVVPRGPLSYPAPGRFRWWPLDLEMRQEAYAKGAPERFHRAVPEGLAAARSHVLELLERLETKERSPVGIVLGGYSQGATLACDVALQSDRPLAGVLAFAPTIVSEEDWIRGMPGRRSTPFFVTHGRADDVLPIVAAERLVRSLGEAGASVTFVPFDGGHAWPFPRDIVAKAGEFLAACAS